MPDIITAPITRDVVSFGIERCQDRDRKLFPTDLELFDYINVVLRELARFTKFLKTDTFIQLVPDQIEYNLIKLLDKVVNIVEIETASASIGGVDTILTFRNKRTFREEILTDTSITTPTYFTYDGLAIAYWRPTTDPTAIMNLRVSRELLTSEEVNAEIDPPEELVAKFLPYIKYGLVKEMCLARPKDSTLTDRASAYDRLYEGYKEVLLIPQTLDSHRAPMRSF